MRSTAAVRAIFFDAGNTLLRMDYDAVSAQLAKLGVATTPPAVQHAEWRARVRLDPHLASATSTEGRSTTERYVRYVLDGLHVTDEAIVRAMLEWRDRYNAPAGLWHAPMPEAEAALRLCRAEGLGAGVISNSNGSIRSTMERTGLARYLDFVIDSGEEGVEKPNPEIFARALAKAGVRPPEAVYVGDLYSIDVLGARGAGLDAVLIDPGRCWGARDCPAAAGPLAAVELVVAGISRGA
ncbi:MAG TPA: HAD-IA family hydrolase [Methylomirabilota bacterium]|jgi:putative hydrolase of the HAD superfamily